MAELSSIPNPVPMVKPAIAEKVFDKQFCTSLEIEAHPSKAWTARFTGFPYDGTEIEQSAPLNITLEDIKALAAKDAELAQAMGMVLAVIGKYLVKCKIKNKRVVTATNIEDILL